MDAMVRTLHPRPRVSIVVPTFNEAKNLPHVFGLIEQVEGIHEVIVVDGRSSDGTIEMALSLAESLIPEVKIVRQTRKGKGNALACGFEAVTGDIVVMLDADGSADPREIPAYVEALVNGADFAKGTRFALGGGSDDITRIRRIGNWGLNFIVNVLFGTRYTDLCYGYNAFWVHCLQVLELSSGHDEDAMLWGDGFEIETVINTRIAKAKLTIAEVKSYEFDRLHGTSNLNAVTDGLRVLKAIMIERFTKPAAAPVVPANVYAIRQAIAA